MENCILWLAVIPDTGQLTAVVIVSVSANDIASVTCMRVPMVHQVSVNISALSSTTGHTRAVDTSMNRSIHQVKLQ